MVAGSFRFDHFHLDPRDRRLERDGVPVELNARYLDALSLLVSQPGKLVTKERFLEEVWRGVPVTDEALTQCIKTLRRQLGDDAASPRFIETVPKHGYRFIAPVRSVGPEAGSEAGRPAAAAADASALAPLVQSWRRLLLLGAAGSIGGGVAGLVGGLFYGFSAIARPLEPGMGAVSVLLVLACLALAVALVGAAGVGFGIAAAGFASRRPGPWSIAGGAAGGLVVGAVVKLLGLDALDLLFGQSPDDITGPAEGALLGAAVGFGAWAASPGAAALSARRGILAAGLAGAAAGILIPLLGGRMMGGSLDLLARQFPGSRLRLDWIGGLFGERGFGPVSQAVTGGLEGMLFAGCIVGAMIVARRRLALEPRKTPIG